MTTQAPKVHVHMTVSDHGVDWEVYVLNYLEDTGLRGTTPAKSGLSVVMAGGGCCGASA